MTVKVTSAIFSACVTGKDALPSDGLPVIALVGRSNVGKSSLINALAGRRELAKTSSSPGKTLTINFYQFNESFYIVDLPGYGYAKASKITRERIQKMMDEFFEACPTLKSVVQILDLRHAPSSLDKQMYKWIQDQNFNYLAILNKSDKLSAQQQGRMFRQIMQDLHSDAPAIAFSNQTNQGKDEVLEAFTRLAAGEEVVKTSSRPRRGDRQGGGDARRPRRERPQPAAGAPAAGSEPRPEGTSSGGAQGQAAQPSQGGQPADGQNPAVPGRQRQQNPRRADGGGANQPGRNRRRDRNRKSGEGRQPGPNPQTPGKPAPAQAQAQDRPKAQDQKTGEKADVRDRAARGTNDSKPEGGESS
ncbi:MAG TPA: ribosome biogenesis GTP-binding protein YihA/YsxC [Candidatus Ozemobacteraceae bacterium]|nr:ribosome biogenesis GTP-binding protein YihA/YsxC [Candidatus Ozemobacteraceae bacterium]